MLIRKRIRAIEKNLMPALQNILIQLNSGVPAFNILVNISSGKYGDLSKEFGKAVREINAGKSQVDALEEMATNNPSMLFRRAIWQLVNGMKAGGDISAVMAEIINALNEQQMIQIQNYGAQLSPLAMFYMLMAVIVPSLSVTFIIVIASFIAMSPFVVKLLFWVPACCCCIHADDVFRSDKIKEYQTSWLSKMVYRLISKLYPQSFFEKYKHILDYANIKSEPSRFLGFIMLSGFLVGWAVAFPAAKLFAWNLWITFIITFASFEIFVYTWLALSVEAKAKFMEKVLPDALQLMSSNLRAGMTPERALLLAARPEFGPLSDEINRPEKRLQSERALMRHFWT